MIIAPAATATTREALVADREAARAYAMTLSQRARERRDMRIEEMRRVEEARYERRDDTRAVADRQSADRQAVDAQSSPRAPRGSRLVDILC